MNRVLLLLFLFFAILALSNAYDDDDLVQEVMSEVEEDEDEAPPQRGGQPIQKRRTMHPLTDMPGASEDIATHYYFPKNPDLRLPIGETVSILCHMENQGKKDYNISAIMGSLNNPFQFDLHIQNYTMKYVGVTANPGLEFSFEYKIQVHPMLEPAEYVLATTVFYEDGVEAFSTTFFNSTVELYHNQPAFDLQDLLKLVLMVAGTWLAGYFGFNLAFGKKPSKTPIKAQGKKNDDWASDFLGSQPKKSPVQKRSGGKK